MQTHSHGWPSTWIPSGSSQDLTASSDLTTSHQMVSQKNTTWGCVQEFQVLWMCKVFVEHGKAHFFLDFTVYFHVLPRVLFPSISTSAHCWEVQGSRLIPASLPAGTSPPAGLRHGTGRSLGSRNWINSGKLQQELHQLSNGSALPCTSSSIFQPNSQEKAREQIYDKTALFAVQKKTWTIFWFHAHRDST